MTRILFVLVAVVLVVAALELPAPRSPDPPPGVSLAPDEYRLQLTRFVSCPWALSDGRRGSVYVAAAPASTPFDLSFMEGGAVEQRLSGVTAAGAAAGLANPRAVGTSSALVEFESSGGAVGVAGSGEDLLAGDLCSPTVPSTWHLPGGSTLEGEQLTLRLFNPFTMDSRVDLWALSELGTEAGESLEGLTVPAGRTRVVPLDELLPGRESLSIIVRPILGSVIPVMVLDTGADTAVWPGTGPSEGWEFPVAGVEGLSTTLVLTNEASLGVEYLVEVFDETGAITAPLSGTLEGPGQARLEMEDLPFPAYGIRVTGDGPFGAAVVGRSETAVAATAGAPTNAFTWSVPGPGAVPADSRVRFLNAGVVDVGITFTMLTTSGVMPSGAVVLAPGSIHTVVVGGPDVVGLLASGSAPFSAGWWAVRDQGAALFGGGVPYE